MKIKDVQTTVLSIPHLGGYQDATIRHPQMGHARCFVHIVTDSGAVGFAPGRGGHAARGLIERTLKPLLIGQDPLYIERIWDDLFWRVRGLGRKGLTSCAISAVDIALWDLKAKFFNVPLYQLLGPYTDFVPVYGSGGWTNLNVEELVVEMIGYVERGMKAVKMKVGKDFGAREREDIERLAAVRQAVGEDVEIYVDANWGYYVKQAIRMAKEFEPYRVGWFEEPVMADDIEGLAAVAKAIDIPVATGEHEYTKYGFRDLIARGGADIIQPNVRDIGGYSGGLQAAAMAQAFNVQMAMGGNWPHINMHLHAGVPNGGWVEFHWKGWRAVEALFDGASSPINGWVTLPEAPGLGFTPKTGIVQDFAVE